MSYLDQEINIRFLHKNPLTEKNLIKAKDLSLLNQVTKYLDSQGLKYEISGSVKRNALRCNPRNYEDIDIIVRKEEINKSKEAILTLVRIAENVPGFEKDFPNFSKYVKPQLKGTESYLNTHIDYRFEIKDPKTSTKIDLCFEGSKRKDLVFEVSM